MQVMGHFEQKGQKVEGMTISGKWDEGLTAEFPDGSTRQLWKANPPHQHPSTCAPYLHSHAHHQSQPTTYTIARARTFLGGIDVCSRERHKQS